MSTVVLNTPPLDLLLTEAQAAFGIDTHPVPSFATENFRFRAGTVAYLFSQPSSNPYSVCSEQISDERFLKIRDWFWVHGWLLSRWQVQFNGNKGGEWAVFTPLEPVEVDLAFHATRSCHVPLIFSGGLLCGTRESCNTDRIDAVGNVYFSEVLGESGDRQREQWQTAHWWAEEFAARTNSDVSEWAILRVDFKDLPGIELYRDQWSKHGIIARVPIPASCISTV